MIVIWVVFGFGIGIIFVNFVIIGVEFVLEKVCNLVVIIIVMGYVVGVMIVGFIVNVIIELFGWEMVFVYGGLFILLMMVVLYFYLLELIEFIVM